MCGDSYNWFYDSKGRIVFVLSDGMGAGGRAAVDSAMATGLMSRLIKAGFGFDCSLRILNSSMLFKSTDESLATVDISCLDLFTGQIDLFKAGAAPTVIRRSGRSGKAQSTSLPAGILREIGFDKASVKIHSGDILLMMSDGVTAEGTDWIYEELENWGNGTAQQLSQRIAAEAKRRRTDGHEDDITVIAAIIERA
jgi:stage II sporulation protein E